MSNPDGKHVVAINVDIYMEEMEGTPEQSAEIILDSDLFLGLKLFLLDNYGYDASITMNEAWHEPSDLG